MKILNIIALICAVARVTFASMTTQDFDDTATDIFTKSPKLSAKDVTMTLENFDAAEVSSKRISSKLESWKAKKLAQSTPCFTESRGNLKMTTGSNWETTTLENAMLGSTTSADNWSTLEMTTGLTESSSRSHYKLDKEYIELSAIVDKVVKEMEELEENSERQSFKWQNWKENFASHQQFGSGSDSICKLMKKIGPCQATIPAYYFDHHTQKCRKFLYGGCLGNANRFYNLKHCRRACLRQRDANQYGGQ